MSKNSDQIAKKESLIKSSKKERSCAYPAHNLEDSIEAVSKLNTNLGKGPFSRESAAKALGYKGVSGASAIKISACTQFGLLMRSGNTYYVSDLAKKILTPTSEEERRVAILEAAETPSLYSSLILEYAGQSLPVMLTNILCRNYGVIENSAKKAADTFRESLEYAGMLRNGVVQKAEALTQEGATEEKPSMTTSAAASPVAATPTDTIELEIPGVEAKIILSKKYAFALSMGELTNGIKALKADLDRVSEAVEGATNESQA